MRRARLLILVTACFLSAAVILGCFGNDGGPDSSPGSLPDSPGPASDAADAAPAPEPLGETITGTGDSETVDYALSGAALNLSIVHTGTGPGFEVVAVNSVTGDETPVVPGVSESSFKGSKVLSVPAGTYMFRVMASGPWTITVEQ